MLSGSTLRAIREPRVRYSTPDQTDQVYRIRRLGGAHEHRSRRRPHQAGDAGVRGEDQARSGGPSSAGDGGSRPGLPGAPKARGQTGLGRRCRKQAAPTRVIIADTAVRADWFSGVNSAQVEHLAVALDRQDAGLVPVILTEILQGFRRDRDFERTRALLLQLPALTLDIDGHAAAARLFRRLRRQGLFEARSTASSPRRASPPTSNS
jgi:predicted nucleic acid-binding protein